MHGLLELCYAHSEVVEMRVLHFGSYWMGENDIVSLMVKDLHEVCALKAIDTQLYSGKNSPWVKKSPSPEHGGVNWLHDEAVRAAIGDYQPEVVVCNSGGMSFSREMHAELKQAGITTVGISLSDPDVFPSQGAHYAPYFDLFYTNAEVSLADYRRLGCEARLLPFAASPRFHRVLPAVPKKYDCIIVGHPRADRLAAVALLDKHFKVGLYGRGWKYCGLIPRGRQVNGAEQVVALNTGRTYLSFSRTVAGYINVKVGLFEAVACGTPVFTEEFAEMQKYFTYGEEIVGYNSLPELVTKLKDHLAHPEKLQALSAKARERLLREHTWQKRWEMVLEDVRQIQHR